MRHLKNLFVYLLLCILIFPTNVAAANEPKLNYKTLNISTVDRVTLKVLNTTKKVFWSSSNKEVVKVSSNGKITPVWFGTATVSAKMGTTTLKCKINVLNEDSWSSSDNTDYLFSIMPLTETKSRIRIHVQRNGKTYASGDLIAEYSEDCYVFLRQGKYNITGAFEITEYEGDMYCILVISESDSSVFETDGLAFDIKTENS